jgi:hypothetical protein
LPRVDAGEFRAGELAGEPTAMLPATVPFVTRIATSAS